MGNSNQERSVFSRFGIFSHLEAVGVADRGIASGLPSGVWESIDNAHGAFH